MDTCFHHETNGKNYNIDGEQIIDCEICGCYTTMTGTKLCDKCYNGIGIFNEFEKETITDSLHILSGGLHPDDEFIDKIKKLIKKVNLLWKIIYIALEDSVENK